jgi:hypothetical protein
VALDTQLLTLYGQAVAVVDLEQWVLLQHQQALEMVA